MPLSGVRGVQYPKLPRTQIIGVLGTKYHKYYSIWALNPIIWVPGPLGSGLEGPKRRKSGALRPKCYNLHGFCYLQPQIRVAFGVGLCVQGGEGLSKRRGLGLKGLPGPSKTRKTMAQTPKNCTQGHSFAYFWGIGRASKFFQTPKHQHRAFGLPELGV